MIIQYTFSISTRMMCSEVSEDVDIEVADNATQDEIDEIVEVEYTQWLFEHNNGGAYPK